MEDSRERTWHWWLLIVLVLAGSIYGRTLEVHYRNRARSAVLSETVEFERLIASELATIRSCLDQGRCETLTSALFPPRMGGADGLAWEEYYLSLNHHWWPELDNYLVATFRWNHVVASAVSGDGTVTDRDALQSLLSGPIPAEISDRLAIARSDLREVKRTGRLYTRVFGWGWKVLLSMVVVVPVATAPARIRRRRAVTIASGFTRPTPTATNTPIPFGPAANSDD